MTNKLKILLVSSEVAPFAKTGGLADVTGSLPKALHKLGHDVRVFLPYYRMTKQGKFKTSTVIENLPVNISTNPGFSTVLQTELDKNIPVYLLQNDKYYDRKELYSTPKGDYPDNAERFIYFSLASLEMLKTLDFEPDIIHCNDWQTGLIPVYLKTLYLYNGLLKNTATVLTVHNLAYQGKFWHFDMHLTGLGWEYFIPDWVEFYGKINLLKAGILHADIVNTVSTKYSKEIQTPEYGHGLEGVLMARSKDLYGIVNGIDTDFFNPATDPHIPANYDSQHLANKRKNKTALRKRMKLPESNVPIIGMIGRLAAQKGWDLVAEVTDLLMQQELQLVVLGSGAEEFQLMLQQLARKYPKKVGVTLGFDPKLAQLIYAGSDMFLMPSRYEPCGLGQLISLRYGTIPIVRSTGGLADTIKNFNPKTQKGNGFTFSNYSSRDMLAAIERALKVYADKPVWKRLMQQGMQQDFSWEHSAKEYVKLYRKALKKKKGGN
jgi:starch synthase